MSCTLEDWLIQFRLKELFKSLQLFSLTAFSIGIVYLSLCLTIMLSSVVSFEQEYSSVIRMLHFLFQPCCCNWSGLWLLPVRMCCMLACSDGDSGSACRLVLSETPCYLSGSWGHISIVLVLTQMTTALRLRHVRKTWLLIWFSVSFVSETFLMDLLHVPPSSHCRSTLDMTLPVSFDFFVSFLSVSRTQFWFYTCLDIISSFFLYRPLV